MGMSGLPLLAPEGPLQGREVATHRSHRWRRTGARAASTASGCSTAAKWPASGEHGLGEVGEEPPQRIRIARADEHVPDAAHRPHRAADAAPAVQVVAAAARVAARKARGRTSAASASTTDGSRACGEERRAQRTEKPDPVERRQQPATIARQEAERAHREPHAGEPGEPQPAAQRMPDGLDHRRPRRRDERDRRARRPGRRAARSRATKPPSECPTRRQRAYPATTRDPRDRLRQLGDRRERAPRIRPIRAGRSPARRRSACRRGRMRPAAASRSSRSPPRRAAARSPGRRPSRPRVHHERADRRADLGAPEAEGTGIGQEGGAHRRGSERIRPAGRRGRGRGRRARPRAPGSADGVPSRSSATTAPSAADVWMP